MKKISSLCVIIFAFTLFACAQIPLTVAPSGGNKKASVSERVGLTDVTIHYDRPAVKGREGKIWGQLVPVGFTDPGFGSSKSAPWRAGANENTTFEFSSAVTINGQPLPAGRYGFFIAFDSLEPTLIFSKNSTSWGHFFYDPKEDALRVRVKPVVLDKPVEWLKYEFSNQTESGATVMLEWEKMAFPIRIETDYVQEQLASFRRELRTERGFIWQGWEQAAAWSAQHNVNLEEALLWSDSATSRNFGGDKSFQAWTTKALILEKLGRTSEAADLMKKQLPLGNMVEIHQYGRRLLQQKKNADAFAIFKMNEARYPGQFTTSMGLARGYSANADFKNALKYAMKAVELAPDETNKKFVEGLVLKLKEGKDIN
jgi:hypothetical protein